MSGVTIGSAFETTYRQTSSLWRERLRAFRASHAPHALVAHGQRWEYLTGGHGERVALLLHGSESDAESLFGAMTLLERDYRVLAPTYPETLASVEQASAGLAALLEKVGAPALVVGYSLGGYLAQALSMRRPDLVARLALCNTGGPATPALRMVRLQYALFAATPGPLLQGAWRAVAGLPLWREAPDLAGQERAFWRAYLAEMSTRISKRAILTHGRLTADFLSGSLTPPTTLALEPGRVLILESARDHTIEPEERAALGALYPAATRRSEPRVGHLSFLTHPERFILAIEQEFRAWQTAQDGQ